MSLRIFFDFDFIIALFSVQMALSSRQLHYTTLHYTTLHYTTLHLERKRNKFNSQISSTHCQRKRVDSIYEGSSFLLTRICITQSFFIGSTSKYLLENCNAHVTIVRLPDNSGKAIQREKSDYEDIHFENEE